MTALFPPYHTPLSASNGANLLCTIISGGVMLFSQHTAAEVADA